MASVVTGVYLVLEPSDGQGGAALAGQTSSPFTFVVHNQGDTSTGALQVTVTCPHAREFSVTTDCADLPPLGASAISGVFVPSYGAVGTRTTTLTVTDAASASTVEASLTGLLVPPS